MIGRIIGKGCCCGVGFLVALAVVGYVLYTYHGSIPGFNTNAETQDYVDSYNKAISKYSAEIEKIKADPKLQGTLSAAQKQAEHIGQMKQIEQAQQECERELQKIKAPADLDKFNKASVDYFKALSEQYHKYEATLKVRDVPTIDKDLRKLDASAQDAASKVDKALTQVPHYADGKKQILDLWSKFKKEMDSAAPPLRD